MKIKILSLAICVFSFQAVCGTVVGSFGSPPSKRVHETRDENEGSLRKKRSLDHDQPTFAESVFVEQPDQLSEFLVLLEQASTVGSVFTVKAMLQMLSYWRGEMMYPPKLLSYCDGDFFYCTEKDKQWYVKYKELVAHIDMEEMGKQVKKAPLRIHQGLQFAFRKAMSAGHPVVMDLFVLDSCKLDKVGKTDFELCIQRANLAGNKDESNFFVGVVKRLLENSLFDGSKGELLTLCSLAHNEHVLGDMLHYCGRYK